MISFQPKEERKQGRGGGLEQGPTRLPDLSIFSRMTVRPKSISKSPSSSLSASSPFRILRVEAALVSSYFFISHRLARMYPRVIVELRFDDLVEMFDFADFVDLDVDEFKENPEVIDFLSCFSTSFPLTITLSPATPTLT